MFSQGLAVTMQGTQSYFPLVTVIVFLTTAMKFAFFPCVCVRCFSLLSRCAAMCSLQRQCGQPELRSSTEIAPQTAEFDYVNQKVRFSYGDLGLE